MEVFARMGLCALLRPRAAGAAADGAEPQGCRITLVNHGADDIAAVHARPFGARDWGPDLLGGARLPAGGTGHLATRLRSGARRWDVWVEYRCGAGHFLRGIDLAGDRQIGVTEFGIRMF